MLTRLRRSIITGFRDFCRLCSYSLNLCVTMRCGHRSSVTEDDRDMVLNISENTLFSVEFDLDKDNLLESPSIEFETDGVFETAALSVTSVCVGCLSPTSDV
uniref:Uncharacterized protein n=1 Tax=Cacopsylla melanoneura TaxID=428564 RepID=A0A8D8MGV7_9HEMI